MKKTLTVLLLTSLFLVGCSEYIETEKAKHRAELQPYKEQLERIFKDKSRKCEKP